MQASVSAAAREYRLVMRRPLNLENLVLVRLERVQFELQVSQVPQRDGLIGTAGREYEFGVRVEAETIHFGGVGVDGVAGFARIVASETMIDQNRRGGFDDFANAFIRGSTMMIR